MKGHKACPTGRTMHPSIPKMQPCVCTLRGTHIHHTLARVSSVRPLFTAVMSPEPQEDSAELRYRWNTHVYACVYTHIHTYVHAKAVIH